VQRSPNECGVSVCDREDSIMRKPRPVMAARHWKLFLESEVITVINACLITSFYVNTCVRG
jgi:hypothetical protein